MEKCPQFPYFLRNIFQILLKIKNPSFTNSLCYIFGWFLTNLCTIDKIWHSNSAVLGYIPTWKIFSGTKLCILTIFRIWKIFSDTKFCILLCRLAKFFLTAGFLYSQFFHLENFLWYRFSITIFQTWKIFSFARSFILLFQLGKFSAIPNFVYLLFFVFGKFALIPNFVFYFADSQNFFWLQVFYIHNFSNWKIFCNTDFLLLFSDLKIFSFARFFILLFQLGKFSAIQDFANFENFFCVQVLYNYFDLKNILWHQIS